MPQGRSCGDLQSDFQSSAMRYSLSGNLRVDVLYDVLGQFVEHLVEHEVDELRGLSLYYTPYASGQKVQFHTGNGETLEHIAVEPVARRLISSSQKTVEKSYKAPGSSPAAGIVAAAISISKIMYEWRLDLDQMAALLKSHPVRIARILEHEMPRLMTRERDRLAMLLEIDRLFNGLGQDASIADWLRSDIHMSAFPGEVLLEQLFYGDQKAILRLRDALDAIRDEYADSPVPPSLASEFDLILEKGLSNE